VERVALEHGDAPGWAWLRALTGDDEEQVVDTSSESAIRLVDQLLVDGPHAVAAPGRAADLAVPDRDRLLAALYRAEFGPRIDATLRCAGCEQPFDLDFSLVDLERSVSGSAAGVEREPGGTFRLADGRRFRLPRGTDERVAAAAPADRAELELLRRCLIEGSAGDDVATLSEAMRSVGPVLDLDVAATCPECGVDQLVRFDLQHYVLRRILDEGRQRAHEIHRIALAYRWSLAEILGLTRARRRIYVALIERETAPARRS
jgi:hypothetical protein